MDYEMTEFHTKRGSIRCCDSLEYMKQQMQNESCDLIFTSPPLATAGKRDYGNERECDCVN